MATYKFVKETNGFSFQVDSGPKRSWNSNAVATCVPEQNGAILQFQIAGPFYEREITMAGNTIQIGGVDVTTDGAESICDQLRDTVFPDTNSGSGGSGATILQSPDDTLWLVTVNDSGALQTSQVASGTPGTLTLFSPDNTEWEVTVNNSGALTTTAV